MLLLLLLPLSPNKMAAGTRLPSIDIVFVVFSYTGFGSLFLFHFYFLFISFYLSPPRPRPRPLPPSPPAATAPSWLKNYGTAEGLLLIPLQQSHLCRELQRCTRHSANSAAATTNTATCSALPCI